MLKCWVSVQQGQVDQPANETRLLTDSRTPEQVTRFLCHVDYCLCCCKTPEVSTRWTVSLHHQLLCVQLCVVVKPNSLRRDELLCSPSGGFPLITCVLFCCVSTQTSCRLLNVSDVLGCDFSASRLCLLFSCCWHPEPWTPNPDPVFSTSVMFFSQGSNLERHYRTFFIWRVEFVLQKNNSINCTFAFFQFLNPVTSVLPLQPAVTVTLFPEACYRVIMRAACN